MAKGTQIVLQKNVPFSQCVLWDKQREFFEKEGVNAWETQVPYYVTSNPYIAHTYSQIMLACIADMVQKGQYDPQQPFYILELGTGPGKFSFHVVTYLDTLKAAYGLSDVRICYVMTDFTDSNVRFWQQNDVFSDALERGVLDFAFFDVEKDKSLHLIHQNITLDKNQITNPLIGIGNYLFDSIPHDVFHSENGALKEACVELRSSAAHAKDLAQLSIGDIEVNFQYKAMRQPYYTDQKIESVLRGYDNLLEKRTSFLFPIAGLRMLNNLAELSNNRLFFLSSDKGYTHVQEIEGRGDPMVALHGECFSMMVNFHAIGIYCAQNGGGYLHQSVRKGLKTSLFAVGIPLAELPQVQYAFQTFCEDFGPTDFFNYHKQFRDHPEHCDMDAILSHLRLSRWDPRIFNIFSQRIAENLNQLDEQSLSTLRKGIPWVVRNIYPIPGAGEYYFDVAIYYHAQSNYQEAIGFYEQARRMSKPEYSILFNMGLCYFSLQNFTAAKEAWEQALIVRPDSPDVQEWLAKIPD